MDKKSNGFTILELLVVIAILGIITAITVPRLTDFKSNAEVRVCDTNRENIERMYSAFLIENDTNYEDSIFNQFLIENFHKVCPDGGVISYEDGKVKCSVHGDESEEEEDEFPGEEVPWL